MKDILLITIALIMLIVAAFAWIAFFLMPSPLALAGATMTSFFTLIAVGLVGEK